MEMPTVLTVEYILSRSLQARFPEGCRVVSTCGHVAHKGTVVAPRVENTVLVKWDDQSFIATFTIDTIDKLAVLITCRFCSRTLSKVDEWFVDRDDQRTCDGRRDHAPFD